MVSSIQSCFHPQVEFLAFDGSKEIETVNAWSHVHLPSGRGTTSAQRSGPSAWSHFLSSFVLMVQSLKVAFVLNMFAEPHYNSKYSSTTKLLEWLVFAKCPLNYSTIVKTARF